MNCFIIMPFGSHHKDPDGARKLDQIYNEWIKPAVESVKIPKKKNEYLNCHRADKEVRPGDIITHIIEQLVDSCIVIADLTGQNPNVFYELGVRHTVRNNTILISENLDDIPFDLRGLRAIPYKYDPENMLKFKKKLKESLEAIITEQEKIDNPIRRFLYDRSVHDLISQAVPPGYDAVRTMVNEMDLLKKEFKQHTLQIRRVMDLVTAEKEISDQEIKISTNNTSFFEGIWESASGSRCYARMVDGELYIPYCYKGDSELSAHYYNCRMIGNTMFGRFQWFVRPISGYSFFKIENIDAASCGWWYSQDLPNHFRDNISQLNELIPRMNNQEWKRVKGKKKFPKWVEAYFNNKLYSKENIDLIDKNIQKRFG